jgi:2'-hydroxyisoflavone reductase
LKKILILGGTGFVGRILSEKLSKTDHDVTLFNRGKRNPSLFPQFKKIIGDRNTEDIFQIAEHHWDVVIDFSGFFPDNIEIVTSLLKGSSDKYIFISSASVYDVAHPAGITYPIKEDFPLLPCTYEQRIDKHPFNFYGNKKAECERMLFKIDWLDILIFRPALIYGRYDPTDRFYYWLFRAKNCDKILLPDDGITSQTNTFAEDFADILLKSLDKDKHQSVYNAVTHPALSLKDMVLKMAAYFNRKPEFITASPEFLQRNNVSEWVGVPLWIKDFSFVLDNNELLNDFKIINRTFDESLKMTIEYYDEIGWKEGKDGISTSREKELIELLKKPAR